MPLKNNANQNTKKVSFKIRKIKNILYSFSESQTHTQTHNKMFVDDDDNNNNNNNALDMEETNKDDDDGDDNNTFIEWEAFES